MQTRTQLGKKFRDQVSVQRAAPEKIAPRANITRGSLSSPAP